MKYIIANCESNISLKHFFFEIFIADRKINKRNVRKFHEQKISHYEQIETMAKMHTNKVELLSIVIELFGGLRN